MLATMPRSANFHFLKQGLAIFKSFLGPTSLLQDKWSIPHNL